MVAFEDPAQVYLHYSMMDDKELLRNLNRITRELKKYAEIPKDVWIEDKDILHAWNLRDLLYITHIMASRMDMFDKEQYMMGLNVVTEQYPFPIDSFNGLK